MTFKILSRSQFIILLWKAQEPICKLKLPISSTGESWTLFWFSSRLFNTAQLAMGPSMDNWIKFSTGRALMVWTRQSRRFWALGLKKIVSQSKQLMPGRCWRPNNKPGHPFAHFEVLYLLIIKANCIELWDYNILYKLIFYKRCHTIINKILLSA